MMATAFDVLFRYTVNMLKLKRPRNWHTIKFTNAQFKARADCMIGTRNILKIMGYTKEVRGENDIQNGLAYPDPSQIDHNIIKLIAAELLIAKTEVKVVVFDNLIFLNNVNLENPYNAPQEMPRDHEPDLYSSMQQQRPSVPPRKFDMVQQPSLQSGYYNPPQPDSHHFNPSLNQHGGYQPPPPQSFGQPSTLQPSSSQQYGPSSSQQYGPSSSQQYGPSSSQQYSHQPRDQTGFQSQFQPHSMNYQSGSHVGYQSSYPLKEQLMSVEDLESTPTDALNTSGNKLDELRQRKANIIRVLDQSNQYAESSANHSTNYSVTTSVSNPVQSSPVVSSQATQPTAASQATPKPPPRVKPRTKFFNVPQGDDTKQLPTVPESSSDEKTLIQEIPPQKLQRPATRTMMKCDVCDFLNHEKLIECMDCNNPKSERWIKVIVPSKTASLSKDPETVQLFEETPSVAQGNAALPSDSATIIPPGVQPPASNVTAITNNAQYNHQPTTAAQYNNQPTAAAQYDHQPTAAAQYNNQPTAAAQYDHQPTAAAQYNNQPTAAAQYNNQPTATAPYNNQPTATAQYNNQPTATAQYNNQPTATAQYNNQSSVAAGVGTGTNAAGAPSLKDFMPVVNYTPEEKERMRLEAKELQKREMMEREQEQQQQQQRRGSRPKEDGGFQSYMPRNDNYGQRNGTMERPTGSVLQGHTVGKMTDPGDTQHYRVLANQGSLIIQDIKVNKQNSC